MEGIKCVLTLPSRYGVQTIEFRLDESRVAFRTNPMAELGFGMVADVSFHLLPIITIVPDLLAVRTDGQQSLQRLDPRKSLFQFLDALRQGPLKFQDANSHLHPRAKLLVVKRLGDVIVGSGLKAKNLVFLAPPCRQEDQIDWPRLGAFGGFGGRFQFRPCPA